MIVNFILKGGLLLMLFFSLLFGCDWEMMILFDSLLFKSGLV